MKNLHEVNQRLVDIKIEHGWILTMDDDLKDFKDGTILIEGKRFTFVGDSTDCEEVIAKKTIDASGRIIMPPFFNGHCHAPMSLLRGLGNDVPLQTWLEKYIWPAEAKYMNAQTVRLGTLLAGIEMIRSGTNIFADMYFFEDEVASAAKELGMRVILGEAILDFPTPNKKNPADGLAYLESLIEKYREDPLVSLSVTAHAPYTCSRETLVQIAEFSRNKHIPLAIHLSETLQEEKEHQRKYGISSTKYLADLGFFDHHAVCHHCNYLSEEDIRIFKDYGVSAITLPSSNSKLASGIAPVYELLKAGVSVGLGTDGAASNNNLNMPGDMQLMLKLQKVKHMNPLVMTAKEALQVATINGAKAYGMDDDLGSLTAGKLADLIIIETGAPHMQPLYDPYAQIAYSMHHEDISGMYIQGHPVMENKTLLNVNEEEIIRMCRSFAGSFNID